MLLKKESPWTIDSFLLLIWHEGRCWNTLLSRTMFLKVYYVHQHWTVKCLLPTRNKTHTDIKWEWARTPLPHTLSHTNTSQAKEYMYIRSFGLLKTVGSSTVGTAVWTLHLNISTECLWSLLLAWACQSSLLYRCNSSFWIWCHKFLVLSFLLFLLPHIQFIRECW